MNKNMMFSTNWKDWVHYNWRCISCWSKVFPKVHLWLSKEQAMFSMREYLIRFPLQFYHCGLVTKAWMQSRWFLFCWSYKLPQFASAIVYLLDLFLHIWGWLVHSLLTPSEWHRCNRNLFKTLFLFKCNQTSERKELIIHFIVFFEVLIYFRMALDKGSQGSVILTITDMRQKYGPVLWWERCNKSLMLI